MAKSRSALKEHLARGALPMEEAIEVTLSEVSRFSILQIAAWPDSLRRVGVEAARFAGCGTAPEPGCVTNVSKGALMRVEPLKWWLIVEDSSAGQLSLVSGDGALLDLSSSRTWIRLSGPKAAQVLNHFLPLNLSATAFPPGSVASTAFHHVGVTLWREENRFNLLLPRSFAASLWEQLTETAAQYGYEVV